MLPLSGSLISVRSKSGLDTVPELILLQVILMLWVATGEGAQYEIRVQLYFNSSNCQGPLASNQLFDNGLLCYDMTSAFPGWSFKSNYYCDTLTGAPMGHSCDNPSCSTCMSNINSGSTTFGGTFCDTTTTSLQYEYSIMCIDNGPPSPPPTSPPVAVPTSPPSPPPTSPPVAVPTSPPPTSPPPTSPPPTSPPPTSPPPTSPPPTSPPSQAPTEPPPPIDPPTSVSPHPVPPNGVLETPTIFIPPSTVVVIDGNLNTSSIVFNGINGQLNVTGCVTIRTDITIQLTQEEYEQLIQGGARELLLISSKGCSNLDHIPLIVNGPNAMHCQLVKGTPKSSPDGLSVLFTVDKSNCKKSKTWWIVLTSVLGGVLVLGALGAVLFTLTPLKKLVGIH